MQQYQSHPLLHHVSLLCVVIAINVQLAAPLKKGSILHGVKSENAQTGLSDGNKWGCVLKCQLRVFTDVIICAHSSFHFSLTFISIIETQEIWTYRASLKINNKTSYSYVCLRVSLSHVISSITYKSGKIKY